MKAKKILFAAALTMGAAAICGAKGSAEVSSEQITSSIDTTSVRTLQSAVVSATKAPANAPFAISEISGRKLSLFASDERELPYLFAGTPGVMAWGENGLGTGTTYLRIRGAGDSRINVTLDGVPMNSPEDQCVFWANMNSYASFLGGVQIQRGVGSSSNGDGAFGGTVALTTAMPSFTPSAEFGVSYGSFNTAKTRIGFSSGLIGKHLIIDGGLSYSRTDGFVHGTNGDGGNWIVGMHILANDRLVVRYRNIGNFERTGQAWNGVVTGNDDNSLLDGSHTDQATWENTPTGIHSYADMVKVGLGRFNNLYERLVTDDDGNFVKDAKGNYLTERYEYPAGSGKYWPRTTDNFFQNHNILSASWKVNDWWKLNGSLHYTYGSGYYDELRYANKLKKFGLEDIWSAKGKTRSDFIRQKGLRQHSYGLVANALYDKDRLHLNIGVSARNFQAGHYGYLTYISNEDVKAAIPSIAPWYKADADKLQYYGSDAIKTDASLYVKATYDILQCLSVFGDVQYRFVHFKTWGINDKFTPVAGGSDKIGPWQNHVLDVDQYYNFVNPKAGLDFHMNGHRAFASFAMSNREPERNNFTDNGHYSAAPKAERLMDYEAGYSFTGRNFELGATLYYMDYKDQLVQTGELSDIGEKLTTNIAKSYRMGMELTAAYTPVKWFTIDGNAALSRNRILDFTEYVEDWDNGTATCHYDNSTLAFSPSAIANINATFRFLSGARAQWHTGVVSRQYLDNSQCIERSLPAYTFSDINLGYTLVTSKVKWMRSVDFGIKLGNIFNSHFAQSGWVYSAVGSGYTMDKRYNQIGYIPAAGFTAIGSITIKF